MSKADVRSKDCARRWVGSADMHLQLAAKPVSWWPRPHISPQQEREFAVRKAGYKNSLLTHPRLGRIQSGEALIDSIISRKQRRPTPTWPQNILPAPQCPWPAQPPAVGSFQLISLAKTGAVIFGTRPLWQILCRSCFGQRLTQSVASAKCPSTREGSSNGLTATGKMSLPLARW